MTATFGFFYFGEARKREGEKEEKCEFFSKKVSSPRPETSTRQKRKKLFSSHRRRYHSEHPDQLPRAGSWRHREERGEVARPRGEGRGRGGEAEDFGVALELPARFFFEVFIVEVRLSELLSRCSFSLYLSLSLSLSLFLSLFLSLSFSLSFSLSLSLSLSLSFFLSLSLSLSRPPEGTREKNDNKKKTKK